MAFQHLKNYVSAPLQVADGYQRDGGRWLTINSTRGTVKIEGDHLTPADMCEMLREAIRVLDRQ